MIGRHDEDYQSPAEFQALKPNNRQFEALLSEANHGLVEKTKPGAAPCGAVLRGASSAPLGLGPPLGGHTFGRGIFYEI
jgi:hypothetical protein